MEGEPSEEDTFKILIATDNHLGYQERDPIRGNDSINTFEEILCIANDKKVDFILLGGDLFHENKPSRKCVHSCMTLLRKHCMGDTPVQFEFVSDQSMNFKHNSFPVVNYEDPNLNVSIPVFSIHGNHDDPTGSESHCALDLLSAAGLVNYFGKYVDFKNVQISPLLLQKGATKLALYGLGSIRDERLHRLFKEGNVSMLRPRQDTDDWFNIFVIHQNRAQHGTTNYIPPNFLDDFLDLVIWGHEHECRLTPEYFESSDHDGFYISQPGSSVATSMSPGEEVPKHVGLLQVSKKSFKMVNIPLQTVRPFYIENIVLSTCGLDNNSPDYTTQIMEYCKEQVDALIEKAQLARNDDQQPELPLIRLRVEHSDQSETFNTYRFGQQFLNKVANPKDIIKFSKKRELKSKSDSAFDKEQFDTIFEAFGMDKVQVEDLITEYFNSSEQEFQLSLLTERGLRCALNEYVQKEEKHAIDSFVKFSMNKAKKHLETLELSRESIDLEISRFTQQRNQDPDAEGKEVESLLASSRKGRNTTVSDVNANESDDLDEMDIDSPGTGRGRGTRGRGGRSRARGSRGTGTRGGRGSKSTRGNDANVSTSRRGRGGSRARGQKTLLDLSIRKGNKNGRDAIEDYSDEEPFSYQGSKKNTRKVYEISDSD